MMTSRENTPTALDGNHEGREATEEITRWLQTDSGTENRRDCTLRILQTKCKKGSAVRPQDTDLRGISLDGEDLSGLDLSGYDLTNADLTGTDLSGANLSRVRLVGASLSGANLAGCELLGADLTGADLDGCQAERAGFGVANLTGTNFFNSHLVGSTFTKSILHNADFGGANLRKTRMIEADLTNTNFTKADLSKADFESSNVAGAVFRNANLRACRLHFITNFDRATWIGADIESVHFCGAYLVRRYIMDENYIDEFRHHSKLHECTYWIWWLTSDCGRSLFRWAIVTAILIAVFALSYLFVTVDYGEHPTAFSPVYFSIVTLTTLGYGDVTPASIPAQVITVTEALLGYVMLGGLLSIFANKMARRAD
jgi:uncharacterized protein YjbI with pentapeptide repeats